mmetsp:Transcript_90922/g.293549  ORF Transcript_90922/g.293549 Transcript_90922/m.293549 type:complete len:211 (+) Transcript_90922:1448-2080(+)
MLCAAAGNCKSEWPNNSLRPNAIAKQLLCGEHSAAALPTVVFLMPQNIPSCNFSGLPPVRDSGEAFVTISRSLSFMMCTSLISCQTLQSVTSGCPKTLSRNFTGAKASRSSLERTTDAPPPSSARGPARHSGAPLSDPPAPRQATESARAAKTGAQLPRDCASPGTTRKPRCNCRRASAGESSMMTYSKEAAHRRQTAGAMPNSLDVTHC